jgi:hypothetical protein
MVRSVTLLGFAAFQLFVAAVLFLSEIWVFVTGFAPRISSYMAFPFSLALFVSGTLAARRGCCGTSSSGTSLLFLSSLFLSLLWMVRACRRPLRRRPSGDVAAPLPCVVRMNPMGGRVGNHLTWYHA